MYTRLGFRQGSRFDKEDSPSSSKEEGEICISCINPVKYIGESKPPTYMFVSPDGAVQEKSNPKPNFQRFQHIYSFDPSEEELPEEKSREKFISIEDFEEEVEKRVQQRLQSIYSQRESQSRDSSVHLELQSNPDSQDSQDDRYFQDRDNQEDSQEDFLYLSQDQEEKEDEKSNDEKEEKKEEKIFSEEKEQKKEDRYEPSCEKVDCEKEEKKIISNGTFIPYFNNELYATNECLTELRSFIPGKSSIKLIVELAGLLDHPPVIYPFGGQNGGKIGNFLEQDLDLTWTNDEDHGRVSGHFLLLGQQYVIIVDKIWKSSLDKEVSFTDIELPAIFQYQGDLNL